MQLLLSSFSTKNLVEMFIKYSKRENCYPFLRVQSRIMPELPTHLVQELNVGTVLLLCADMAVTFSVVFSDISGSIISSYIHSFVKIWAKMTRANYNIFHYQHLNAVQTACYRDEPTVLSTLFHTNTHCAMVQCNKFVTNL